MTMLTVVQQFCLRTGIPSPVTVIGSTDTQVLQVMAILEEEGNDLSLRGGWNELIYEEDHTTLNQEDQGAMATIATNGFRYIKNNTIWDRTERLPVIGPADGQEWQSLKGFISTGPRYIFRIRGGRLLVNPDPPAGNEWFFEYASQNWILNGSTYKQYFTADTDTILLPETLVLQGLRWRWKKEKGLEYAEDFRTYEMQVKDAIGRDGGKSRIYADRVGRNNPTQGIFVPQGNWLGS